MTAARTLPVTPAERACATVLRAYLAWIDTPEDVPDDGQWEASAVLEDLGDALDKREFLAHEGGPSPAGAALLARVEAADAHPSERAAIVAFLASEEDRYRRNSKDPMHDPGGRGRCLHKASVLATVGRYIERGDHLTPLDAQPRTPESVLRAMLASYSAAAIELRTELWRGPAWPPLFSRQLDALDHAITTLHNALGAHLAGSPRADESLMSLGRLVRADYAARLSGATPIDAPPAKEPAPLLSIRACKHPRATGDCYSCPDCGVINNCNLENGEPERTCQMCPGKCPNRAQYAAKEPR